MSKQTLTFVKQSDGTWQSSFNTSGTLTLLQVSRAEDAELYCKVTTNSGTDYAILAPPQKYREQVLQLNIAEGAVVTVVSHAEVEYGAVVFSELAYYTKAETDEKIAELYVLEPVVVDTLPTASADTMHKLYFVPKSGGGTTGNASDEYITVREVASGSGTDADPYVYTYAWEQVGDTAVDISGKSDKLVYDGSVTVSNNTASVTFPADSRKYFDITASANLTLNITANNSDENYILISNTGSVSIHVTLGTVSFGNTALTAANIITPINEISCPAGKSVEISAIVFSGKAIISCSGDLETKSAQS